MVENVSPEIIKDFLEGSDPQKYIVGIEADYYDANVYLIINNPETGKKSIETHRLRPFVWMKQEGANRLFNGDRGKIRVAMDRHNIKITKLKIDGPDGKIPSRMETGFKYLVQGSKSYGDLLNFFKEAGVDVYGEEKHFVALAPAEQFLIQTNKRLFKGFEFYDDLHRFQFDLETTGLDPKTDSIFQIGMKDNRGFEQVIEVIGETEEERNITEIAAINAFFQFIDYLKPDIIAGYNSEFFDFDFIVKRCEVLGYNVENIAKTLKMDQKFKRTKGTVKFGSETEYYEKTTMWGHNIIDISHAVRRAQAINSDIKAWGLKYITKYTEINKPNRVYVDGDKIHTTWADKVNHYALNDTNGDYYIISEDNELKDGYGIVTGKYIVERYLLDDLWETEQIDVRYNQASFLLSKMIPTSFTKTSTMGNASIWKLLMCAWSYGQGLGIPDYEPKREFTGGLSRLLRVGYSKKVVKLDYAALYPNIQLSWDIFPDLDISGVMKGLLQYIVDTRDRYKFEKNKYSADSKRLAKEGNYEESEKLGKLSNDLGKKEQPIKILANSFFGAYGAPYIFPWGNTNSAEETTCRGRQYLRLMVKHFTEEYNFITLILDTDGINVAIPESISNFKYVSTGNHRFNEINKEYSGVEAAVAKFNDIFMENRMGLDIDDEYVATINFSRKNYANHTGKKIKLVGNTVKSKKMPTYIEEFMDNGIKMLLNGNGTEFLDYYYSHVQKIYNCDIPLAKIASKARVKISVADYKKKMKSKNKSGGAMAKQAHMELAIQHDLSVGLGDVIYYVNTGDSKSKGDIQTIKNKETGKLEKVINCKLIPVEEIENNPDLTTDEYNIPKYLAAFNKRIKPLLVCFSKEIRNKIIIDMVKDKTTKELLLEPRTLDYDNKHGILTSGEPMKESDQDTYQDLMTMEDKEFKFWINVNKTPNCMGDDEWVVLRDDYIVRMEAKRIVDIANEKAALEDIFKKLELSDIINIGNAIIPSEISVLAFMSLTDGFFYSNLYDVKLLPLEDVYKYESDAKERDEFYKTLAQGLDFSKVSKYDLWFNDKIKKQTYSGDTISEDIKLILEEASSIIDDESDDESDED